MCRQITLFSRIKILQDAKILRHLYVFIDFLQRQMGAEAPIYKRL